ncbi:hypothetical protein QCA50_019330 [Cerrena zonata]|uniref:Uncharacterized protein n=1 Tax=Cerrena zonata TaxID=2478898 RepID=A0AAW0FE12_9APHY
MASNPSGRFLAIATVTGCVATLGYMYVAGKQVKSEEGSASIYKKQGQGAGLQSGESDARMASKDVRAAVQGDRKP